MNNLIKISENQTITAKELYAFLELGQTQYARWTKKNIELNEYYQDGQDWQVVRHDVERNNPNPTTDFELTIDFAKHLCMLSRSTKGKQARDYFIEVEKRYIAAQEVKAPVPSCTIEDQEERGMRWLEEIREHKSLMAAKDNKIAALQEDIELFQPKAEFYDSVIDMQCFVSMADAAKTLTEFKGGQNLLFKYLIKKRLLAENKKPYQEYTNRGYFKLVEKPYNRDGVDMIYLKTVVSNKGLDYIRKLIIADRERVVA